MAGSGRAHCSAFPASKIDAVCVVGSDALVTGATGGKTKIIALLDYSEGRDMIVGATGGNAINDQKGKKNGI